MKQSPVRLKQPHVLSAPPLDKAEMAAIQALHRGVANEGQQKMALDCIIRKLCATFDEPYRDSERDTIFALGMAHVGRELVTITNLRLGEEKNG